MKKWLSVFFVSVAVLLTVGHSALPHIHDLSEAYHHHEKGHDHRLVHFGTLDDSIIPAKIHGHFATQDLVLDLILCQYQLPKRIPAVNQPHISFEEYPPPREFQNIKSFRGPPRS